MKGDSLLYKWFTSEFSGSPKIRAVNDLLREGHRGLAESVAVKALMRKYGYGDRIRVNSLEGSYFV